jgi:Cdc6-like AAA superfamily ATPase
MDRKEDLDILNWLTLIEHAPKQIKSIEQRQPGTGQWLLDSPRYQAWLKTNRQTLFCPGIPGAGKTILSSIVVDDLQRFQDGKNIAVAYFYCEYTSQESWKEAEIYRSLLKQLCQERQKVPQAVKDLYQRHNPKSTQPLPEEIDKILRTEIQSFSRTFVIIDALDEYHLLGKSTLRDFMTTLFEIQDETQLNIFATSRHIPEIGSLFNGPQQKEKCQLEEIRARDEDLQRFVNSKIGSLLLSNILKQPNYSDLSNRIRTEVVKASEGM